MPIEMVMTGVQDCGAPMGAIRYDDSSRRTVHRISSWCYWMIGRGQRRHQEFVCPQMDQYGGISDENKTLTR